MLERLSEGVNRRTRVARLSPHQASALRLIGAVLADGGERGLGDRTGVLDDRAGMTQGQRTLKCWHQKTSGERPLGTRADSRVFGDLGTALEAQCLPLFPTVASC